MVGYFHDLWEAVVSVIKTMGPWDILDIALLSVVMYYFYKLLRETRAGQLFKGIVFLLFLYAFVKVVKLKAITYLLERLFSVSVLAILIVFQPEVRRAVEKLGHSQLGLSSLRFMGGTDDAYSHWSRPIDEICKACAALSRTKTGALIVIERRTRLGEYIGNGTIINADVSEMLLGNLFFKNSPLHDGAVIVRSGRILAGGCQLPKPQKEELIDKALGSRHRAAIGMSENSDAIILVVSEETGQISVAENGSLSRNYSRKRLEDLLRARLLPEPDKARLSYKLMNFGKPQSVETEETPSAAKEGTPRRPRKQKGGQAHGKKE